MHAPLSRSVQLIVLTSALLFAATNSAIAQSASRAHESSTSRNFLDSIPTWLAESRVPGLAVALLDDTQIATVRTYGLSRVGVALTPNALWNVASLTKPVVSMTTLRLVNAGRLGLDASLDMYWIDPDIRDNPAHSALTTRLILSHQTGFPNWRWLMPDKKLGFLFLPGTAYKYSGEGFEYLRHALETMSGRSLQQLSDSVLFRPLGMSETTYGWNESNDSSRFVTGHDTSGIAMHVTKRPTSAANAADWLVTTIDDYAKFAQSVLRGAGLKKPLFAEMMRGQVQMNGKPDDAMGLGWEVLRGPDQDAHILIHTGSDDGIKTLIVLLPDSGRGMVVFTNGDRGMDVTMRILRAAFGLKALTP